MVTHAACPEGDNSSDQTKAVKPRVQEGAEKGSWDAVARSHQQKLEEEACLPLQLLLTSL